MSLFSQHWGFAYVTGHLCIKGSLKANNRRCLGCQAEPPLLFPVRLKSRQHFEASETRDRTKRRNLTGAYDPYGDCESIKYETACEVSCMGTIFFLLLLLLYRYIFLTMAELTPMSTQPAAWSSSISLPTSDGNNWTAAPSPSLN